MIFSELHEIMVNKVTFVGFRRDNRPPGSAPGPLAVDTQHSGGLFSE